MDGQPVDPSKWNQKNPYIPVLKENIEGNWNTIDINRIYNNPNREWRIFGRSTSDDKGPPMMLINALKIINKLNLEPKFNIKLIIDFQEEMSSPTISSAVCVKCGVLVSWMPLASLSSFALLYERTASVSKSSLLSSKLKPLCIIV